MSIGGNRIALEQAVPGMSLAAPLFDAKGDVLLPSGATLSEAMLVALMRRGIQTLEIEGINEEPPASDAELEAERERRQQRLARLFRKYDAEGAGGLLRQYVTSHRIGKGR